LLLVNSCRTSAPEGEYYTGSHEVFEQPIGYVNDFEGLLDSLEVAVLDSTLVAYERRSTNEIAIVTIPEISPYETMFDYSLDLANYWGVGKKEKNNGVFIALSKELRAVHIHTGRGVEEDFSDIEVKVVLDSIMLPAFAEEEYFRGLVEGVKAIKYELEK